ncbi:MAG: topoisomerase DNA-binding C4 zinc finger domain-containing protein, partial [Bacillales bacterium]|nr:topoisomerase DNA-binding C4 zinc finger domain-containing protein [Bacillales bacterium]
DDFEPLYNIAKESFVEEIETEDLGLCPKCSSPLIKKNGKYGPFIACSNFPKCKYIVPSERPPLVIPENAPLCPQCHKGHIIVKKGPRNTFKACSNYPECKYIVPSNKAKLVIPENAPLCPTCKTGHLIKRTVKGSSFMACSNFPKCKHKEKIKEV